ncbi:hypothetical protein scyTo_0012517 [Scyliorhinus torazame]|uniref:Peptidase S1 domain-containing protein n=1 Tax=Scyliorhinus torazame TaxID=75743 RepID=A0A401P9Z8_SCYTO|nr:hypothetical protein [Scyliorhinus torazame]
MLQVAFIVSIINALAGQGSYGVEIIGGQIAKRSSGLYMASIQVGNEHLCGGTLISGQWVLTSANCAKVVLGAHSLKNNRGEQIFGVKVVKVHRQYNNKTERNNLALLKLNKTAKQNKYVNVFKLPKSTKTIKYGTKCKTLGWGQTTIYDNDPSDILQEISLTVIKQETCNSKRFYNHNPVITDDMICAGDKEGRAKTCRGDAGGPLICMKKQLTGIAVYERGCEVMKKPGIYTRLTNDYLKWIKGTIKGQSGNFTFEQN